MYFDCRSKGSKIVSREFSALKIRSSKLHFVLEIRIFDAWRSFDKENT